MPRPPRSHSWGLTPRQKQIRDLRWEGYSYKQIAHTLGISVNYVSSCLSLIGFVRPPNRYRIQKTEAGWLVLDTVTQEEQGPFTRNHAYWVAKRENRDAERQEEEAS